MSQIESHQQPFSKKHLLCDSSKKPTKQSFIASIIRSSILWATNRKTASEIGYPSQIAEGAPLHIHVARKQPFNCSETEML